MEKENKNIVEEAMNKLVKEILKNGDEKKYLMLKVRVK